jgi:hypothetical protein
MRDCKDMSETQRQPGPVKLPDTKLPDTKLPDTKLPDTELLNHITNRMVRRSLSRLVLIL